MPVSFDDISVTRDCDIPVEFPFELWASPRGPTVPGGGSGHRYALSGAPHARGGIERISVVYESAKITKRT